LALNGVEWSPARTGGLPPVPFGWEAGWSM